jgi:hypothetical protein
MNPAFLGAKGAFLMAVRENVAAGFASFVDQSIEDGTIPAGRRLRLRRSRALSH